MSEKKPNFALRCFPSLTDLAFVLPVGFMISQVVSIRTLMRDGDTGWHVRTGEWILQHGSIPYRDPFSYTRPGEVWFAWEWLWDVLAALLHQRWGMAAVVVASIAMLGATSALTYRLARRYCPNAFVAFALTTAAVAASAIHWLARPHLVTLLMSVVFISLLERVREGNSRLLWLLPVLTIPWANLHGGFVVGVVVTCIYAAGQFIHWALSTEPEARRIAWLAGSRFSITAIACLAASLINPYFYRLHQHVWFYLANPHLTADISEFRSLSFHHPVAPYFEAMIAFGVLAAAWSLYRRRYESALLCIFFLHISLISMRNIPLFVLLSIPAAAAMLWEVLQSLSRWHVPAWFRKSILVFQECGTEMAATDARFSIPVASVLAVALVALLALSPNPPEAFAATYDPERYPEKALPVLKGAEMSHSIFTDDEWGDYLLYRLYPNTKVFVDGRSDFYGERLENDYRAVMQGRHDWKTILKRYHVDTILLSIDRPLVATLKESGEWRPIYDDGRAIVFRTAEALAAGASRDTGATLSASKDRGNPAIARSPNNLTSVIERSPSYARR